jgi:hypothetical protein
LPMWNNHTKIRGHGLWAHHDREKHVANSKSDGDEPPNWSMNPTYFGQQLGFRRQIGGSKAPGAAPAGPFRLQALYGIGSVPPGAQNALMALYSIRAE